PRRLRCFPTLRRQCASVGGSSCIIWRHRRRRTGHSLRPICLPEFLSETSSEARGLYRIETARLWTAIWIPPFGVAQRFGPSALKQNRFGISEKAGSSTPANKRHIESVVAAAQVFSVRKRHAHA